MYYMKPLRLGAGAKIIARSSSSSSHLERLERRSKKNLENSSSCLQAAYTGVSSVSGDFSSECVKPFSQWGKGLVRRRRLELRTR